MESNQSLCFANTSKTLFGNLYSPMLFHVENVPRPKNSAPPTLSPCSESVQSGCVGIAITRTWRPVPILLSSGDVSIIQTGGWFLQAVQMTHLQKKLAVRKINRFVD